MAMARTAGSRNVALRIDDAWNAVALEERLELLSRAHANGVAAGIATILLLGTIGYGFDQIYLLLVGIAVAFFSVPMFMSYSWRRAKPAVILAYLAVRTVARRYAYGYNLTDLDIILIYRGNMREVFDNRETEEMVKRQQEVSFDSTNPDDMSKSVWICLLRGAVVLLSERAGGAKLEFICPITNEVVLRRPSGSESNSESAVVIEGVQMSKGRTIIIDTISKGAQYVFEKQLGRLIAEYKAPIQMYRTSS